MQLDSDDGSGSRFRVTKYGVEGVTGGTRAERDTQIRLSGQPNPKGCGTRLVQVEDRSVVTT